MTVVPTVMRPAGLWRTISRMADSWQLVVELELIATRQQAIEGWVRVGKGSGGQSRS
jgi:hypothetical protein